MKRVLNAAGSVLGIAALVILATVLLLTFGGPGERPVAQEPAGVDASSVALQPPPTTPTAVAYPPPPTPTVVPTASPTPEPYPQPPTMTPVPTSTQPPSPTVPPWPPSPQPTPTRRPGPTATPFPIRPPAPDASGMILYTPADRQAVMGVPVDGQGQKVAEVAPLPLVLDFRPILDPPSPDGRYLLLRQPVEPAGIPYVFDRQTQELWPLLRGHPMQQHIIGRPFGWHPDSRHVLFWMFNNEELWLVDAETGEYTVLALTEGSVQGAAISPDGQNIVYVARSDSSYRTMWKVSAAGSDARALFNLGGPSYVFGWSPNGSYILHAGGPNVGFKDAAAGTPIPGGPLWLIDPEGQNRRPLQGHFLFGWGFRPVWSPDSQWVAFTGPDAGQSFGCAQKDPRLDPETCMFEGTAIYIENIQTGEVRRLASGIEPVWSPDGSMLAFLSNQSGVPEIWVIGTDGAGLQQITADAQRKWRIVWAPARR